MGRGAFIVVNECAKRGREKRMEKIAVIIIVLVVMCEKWMRGVEIRIMLSGKERGGY